jgi:hypothetical protein
MIYKLMNFQDQLASIGKFENGVQTMAIPISPDNTDYQAYLKWVAEGNTPEAAE